MMFQWCQHFLKMVSWLILSPGKFGLPLFFFYLNSIWPILYSAAFATCLDGQMFFQSNPDFLNPPQPRLDRCQVQSFAQGHDKSDS